MSEILHLNLHREWFAAIVAKIFAHAKPADVTEILKSLKTFGRARNAVDGKFRN